MSSNNSNNKATAPRGSVSIQDEYDDNVLHRAVADAGRWAFGTILVEMWVLSEDWTCLFRPENGWWVDPIYHSNCQGPDCQVCRIIDSSLPDYVPPSPLAPGEGLPGVLWAESSGGQGKAWTALTTNKNPSESMRSTKVEGDSTSATFRDTVPSRRVSWRQVQAIAEDPDQPYNPRLQLLAQLGLGWAAAVPFAFYGQQGIMIYMAREHVDLAQLQSPKNEMYLQSACDFAGAAYALRGPRRQMVHDRQAERAAAWRRIRAKILTLRHMGCSLKQLVEENAVGKKKQDQEQQGGVLATFRQSVMQEWLGWLQAKSVTTLRKCRGGGSQTPPPFTLRQTLLTFVGAFSSLLMVTRLSYYMTRERGTDFRIVLGPFGALATLHYGLTAAPASQPRNAILGQIISLTIAMAIGYADDTLDPYLRQSLATALTC